MKLRTILHLLALFAMILCPLITPTPGGMSAQTKPTANTAGRQLQHEEIKALPVRNKRWALVIGVDDYSETQISRLKGAAKDARTLASALIEHAAFPEDQVILLASDQPSALQPRRSTILRYLSNLRGTVPKDGLLLVAFAGHGIERGGRAFLLPSDALGVNDMALLEDTAIGVERVKESIKATGVGQVILILDACRSDPSAGRSGGDNLMTQAFSKNFNFEARNRDIQAFATLYATEVGQRAYEYDAKGQGYFTWALVEGLRGAASNGQGQVTLQLLVQYLETNVPKLVQRDLGADKRQRPFAIVEGYRAADLVVAVAAPVGAASAGGGTGGPTSISAAAQEQALWDAVKDSSDPQDLREYLAKYPNGAYVAVAQVKLRRLPAEKIGAGNSEPANTVRPSAGNSEPASAVRPSAGNPPKKARVTQTIGVTDVSVTYYRPGVMGRRIWGEPTRDNAVIVPYGYGWRTGGNEATLLVVTDDVLINGQKLAAGTYSLHMIPTKDQWTIVFNGAANQWGSVSYDPAKDTLRVKAKPEWVSENQESLQFSFETVTDSSATVTLRWEKIRVPFTVSVADVNATTLTKLRRAVGDAKPDDWRTPMQAGNWVVNNLIATDDAEGMGWLDQSIKVKATFQNLSAKANALYKFGKKEEAYAIAEQAIQQGKTDKVNTANFEKRLADMKAGKI